MGKSRALCATGYVTSVPYGMRSEAIQGSRADTFSKQNGCSQTVNEYRGWMEIRCRLVWMRSGETAEAYMAASEAIGRSTVAFWQCGRSTLDARGYKADTCGSIRTCGE